MDNNNPNFKTTPGSPVGNKPCLCKLHPYTGKNHNLAILHFTLSELKKNHVLLIFCVIQDLLQNCIIFIKMSKGFAYRQSSSMMGSWKPGSPPPFPPLHGQSIDTLLISRTKTSQNYLVLFVCQSTEVSVLY